MCFIEPIAVKRYALKQTAIHFYEAALRATFRQTALARFNIAFIFKFQTFATNVPHRNSALIMTKNLSGCCGIFRRINQRRWRSSYDYTSVFEQRTIFVMICFISSDQFNIESHCLGKLNQKRQKRTVMMVRRGDKRNQRETLFALRINNG